MREKCKKTASILWVSYGYVMGILWYDTDRIPKNDLFLPESASSVGMQELFERLNLFEQLFSFVRIFDPYPFTGEILEERAAVNV